MSFGEIYSGSIYNPDLQNGHPITIAPVTDAGDANPMVAIKGQGGIVDQRVTEQFRLSWAPIRGAVSYELHGSISPLRMANVLQSGLTAAETVFDIPVFTQAMEYYFWVTWVDANGVATYITADAATLETRLADDAFGPDKITPDYRWITDVVALDAELKKDLEYVRAGHRLQLEIGAETGWLFKMRHGEDKPWGIPCTCTEASERETDPGYHAFERCGLCFGTGVFGGFYPAVPLKFRYAGEPEDRWVQTRAGRELRHKFSAWTLWQPYIGAGDLLVRKSTGERFEVTKRAEGMFRGIRTQQQFDLKAVEKTDIRSGVTNAAIQRALQTSKNPLFAADRFLIFG